MTAWWARPLEPVYAAVFIDAIMVKVRDGQVRNRHLCGDRGGPGRAQGWWSTTSWRPPASLELFSQGGAFVNNLVCGTLSLQPVVDRPTPFHVPHSTQVAGYAAIYGGDDRHVGNIYLGGNGAAAYGETAKTGQAAGYGTAGYNGHPRPAGVLGFRG